MDFDWSKCLRFLYRQSWGLLVYLKLFLPPPPTLFLTIVAIDMPNTDFFVLKDRWHTDSTKCTF